MACAAAIFSAGSGAAGAPPALLQAVQKTNSAKSANITLDERVGQGGQVTMIRLQGVEQPQTKSGSFVLDISPAQPGVGEATEILVGSKLYIHYPILDTLHAKNPKVKSWIVVDTSSSLGVDPSSLTALEGQQLQDLTGIKIVGTGTEGRRCDDPLRRHHRPAQGRRNPGRCSNCSRIFRLRPQRSSTERRGSSCGWALTATSTARSPR